MIKYVMLDGLETPVFKSVNYLLCAWSTNRCFDKYIPIWARAYLKDWGYSQDEICIINAAYSDEDILKLKELVFDDIDVELQHSGEIAWDINGEAIITKDIHMMNMIYSDGSVDNGPKLYPYIEVETLPGVHTSDVDIKADRLRLKSNLVGKDLNSVWYNCGYTLQMPNYSAGFSGIIKRAIAVVFDYTDDNSYTQDIDELILGELRACLMTYRIGNLSIQSLIDSSITVYSTNIHIQTLIFSYIHILGQSRLEVDHAVNMLMFNVQESTVVFNGVHHLCITCRNWDSQFVFNCDVKTRIWLYDINQSYGLTFIFNADVSLDVLNQLLESLYKFRVAGFEVYVKPNVYNLWMGEKLPLWRKAHRAKLNKHLCILDGDWHELVSKA